MRTVKSKSELARLAVQRGAKATLQSGETINAGQTKSALRRVPEPPPKKETPAPAPQAAPRAVEPEDRAILKLASEMLAASRQERVEERVEEKKEPTAWVFDIRRGADGMMSQIIATPVAVKT